MCSKTTIVDLLLVSLQLALQLTVRVRNIIENASPRCFGVWSAHWKPGCRALDVATRPRATSSGFAPSCPCRVISAPCDGCATAVRAYILVARGTAAGMEAAFDASVAADGACSSRGVLFEACSGARLRHRLVSKRWLELVQNCSWNGIVRVSDSITSFKLLGPWQASRLLERSVNLKEHWDRLLRRGYTAQRYSLKT